MLTDRALEHCDDYDMKVLTEIEHRLEPVPDSECVVWTGLCHGVTPVRSYHGKRISIRRIIYQLLVYPELKPEDRLGNTCGTERCLHPDHIGPWEGPPGLTAGPGDIGMLNMDAQAEIMATPPLWGSGVKLAKRFNCSPSLISKIRHKLRDEHSGVST